jgi:hypothetical protein
MINAIGINKHAIRVVQEALWWAEMHLWAILTTIVTW